MRRLLTLLVTMTGLSVAGMAAPPRIDPATAVRRQLDDAFAADASAPLILFIARYPDEPIVMAARFRLATRRQSDPSPARGPDGAIVAAFDRARLDGVAALDAFAARYPNHPLGAEAARWSRWLRAGAGVWSGTP